MATDSDTHRFVLVREHDASGVSGVGVVAEGLEFTDGRVAMRWLSNTSSISVFDSVADVRAVHGHGGNTKIRWVRERPATATPEDLLQSAANFDDPVLKRFFTDDWLLNFVKAVRKQ